MLVYKRVVPKQGRPFFIRVEKENEKWLIGIKVDTKGQPTRKHKHYIDKVLTDEIVTVKL